MHDRTGAQGARGAWSLYDELLAQIPRDVRVTGFCVGPIWTAVLTEAGCGLALSLGGEGPSGIPPMGPSAGDVSDWYAVGRTPTRAAHGNRFAGRIVGAPLRDVAELVRSWEYGEAAVGLAAINSWMNRADAATPAVQDAQGDGLLDIFAERIAGSKVAFIGHMPGVERLREVCELSILERVWGDGDFPDPACEYLLPEQDVVFISGSALVNKTAPRLLELSRDAYTIVWGPSTTCSRALFEHGADALTTFVSSPCPQEREREFTLAAQGATAAAIAPCVRNIVAYR